MGGDNIMGGDRYYVLNIVKQKGKTVGADILDKKSNRQITIYKDNFKILANNLENAILVSDNILRGKNGKLRVRNVEDTDKVSLSGNREAKKTVKILTIMHEDSKVLTVDRSSDTLTIYNKDKLPYSIRKRELHTSDVTEWIIDRISNINRTYMNMVYIARKVGRDRYKVLKDSCGISFTDNFWIHTNDVGSSWEELKRLRDENLALSTVALTGIIGNSKEDLNSGYTSLFTTKGYFAKAILGGYMFKRKEDAIL